MADVPLAKYQKLLKAYGETKQKNGILKTAVQELQQQTRQQEVQLQQQQHEATPPKADGRKEVRRKELASENEALKATLADKERSIRLTAQELDTLGFQNKQLMRRLEVMQEDTSKESKGRNSKKLPKAAEEAMQLQEEELRRKIRENEGLHRRRQEEARNYEQQIRDLHAIVQTTKAELAEKLRAGTLKDSESAGAAERFQLERVQLKQRVEDLTAELALVNSSADRRTVEARDKAAQNAATIKSLEELAASKSFFDDTARHEYNALNVPPAVDSAVGGKTNAINDESLQGIREFVSAFSNLLTYFEERAAHISVGQPEGMSKATQDYCASLNGHSKYIKPLDRSFAMYHDGTATLGPFAGAFSNFDNYLRRLLPHLEQVLNEENQAADCTSMLKATNIAVAGTIKDVVTEITTMSQHVTDLSAQDGATFSNIHVSVSAAVGGVTKLLGGFGNLASHYSTKVALEQQLARSTAQSKSTDTMINQALTKIVTNFERLVKVLEDNKGSLSAGTAYAIRGVPAAALAGSSKTLEVKALQIRATRFMRTLLCDPPDSVPYAEALALSRGSPTLARDGGGSGQASGGGIAESVGIASGQYGMVSSDVSARMSELEQQREHYKLECELLKMKLDRFEVVHAASSRDGSDNEDVASPTRSGTSAPSSESMPTHVPDGAELIRVREHYEDRIKSLMAQLQFADSKAVSFHDECRSVAMRLEAMRHTQAKQGAEYRGVNDTISGLKADLETTKRNYEEQLSAMTEHVMTMNDQIQQKDHDIDTLKQVMKQGGGKSKQSKSSKRGNKAEDFPQFSRFG